MMNRRQQAHRTFFLAAIVHACLSVPLAVLGMTGAVSVPPGLIGAGHGFEMLFGFALAVVAGYTLGPMTSMKIRVLLGLWTAGRLAQWLAPFSLPALLLSALFALALGREVVPKFFAAKKWRNRIMVPLLAGLCAFPAAYALAWWLAPDEVRRILVLESVLFFALLMAFMGGRILAPALAGEYQRIGIELQARVQPRLESGLIILLALAAITAAIPGAAVLSGIALIGSAILILVRLLRWRLWLCHGRPDLLGLSAGYAWLAVGLAFLGWRLMGQDPVTEVFHLITVGALGTLTSGVMARIHYQRTQRRAPPTGLVAVMAVLIAGAALARLLAGLTGWWAPALGVSAALWTLAYLSLGLAMLGWVAPTGRKRGLRDGLPD